MSANSLSFSVPLGSDVLGELLHSLSQPLTTLQCSLELSIEHVAEQGQDNVASALQQTERVIGMVRLMREYLDAEQRGPGAHSVALEPALRAIVEELASVAEVRAIQVRLTGESAATLRVPEARLRLALQYLIAAIIEAQPAGGKVMLLLGEGPAGTVLRAEGSCRLREHLGRGTNPGQETSDPALRRVRQAIAVRVLEGSGASLVVANNHHGEPVAFVLRIAPSITVPA
jgi:signal transduction histidine kinase